MRPSALCALRGGGVLARVAFAALLMHLAGCALPARERPGALRADVLARLGPPSATFALPPGERLLYSELPAGFAAYALDFDASGRLLRNEQVLTQTRFENLPLGTWTSADVQRTFGAPLRVERVARFDGDIWTYRFRHNSDLRLAHVHLDRQGVVRQVLFTDELPNFDNARD
ncbi:hypothetical protein DBR12_05070 [Acidovorax sp. HMWF029]|nr:hypothetical protein [Acidovorax sp. HMWF029]PTT21993.1 hypothetical protein DBR12_05070 [Acidovorax sp. HMWF029]